MISFFLFQCHCCCGNLYRLAGRNSNGGSHGNGTSSGVAEGALDEDSSSQVVFLLACIKEEQARLKQQVRAIG
jgi:hypothetical protein